MNIKLSTLKYSTLFLASLVLIFASALFFPILFAVVSGKSKQAIVAEGTWRGGVHYSNGKQVPSYLEVKAKTPVRP